MQETMIERLSRILSERAAASQGGAQEGADLRDHAHEILEAMIEPAPSMVEAGAEIVPGNDPANHAEVAKDVWRAMIRAALVG